MGFLIKEREATQCKASGPKRRKGRCFHDWQSKIEENPGPILWAPHPRPVIEWRAGVTHPDGTGPDDTDRRDMIYYVVHPHRRPGMFPRSHLSLNSYVFVLYFAYMEVFGNQHAFCRGPNQVLCIFYGRIVFLCRSYLGAFVCAVLLSGEFI